MKNVRCSFTRLNITFSQEACYESLGFGNHNLMNYTNMTEAAKLTCQCNTLRTLNSFARSDSHVVIDGEPQPSHTCKTR